MHEWLNRLREVDLRFRASLHLQLGLWTVGWWVGWLTVRERAVSEDLGGPHI